MYISESNAGAGFLPPSASRFLSVELRTISAPGSCPPPIWHAPASPPSPPPRELTKKAGSREPSKSTRGGWKSGFRACLWRHRHPIDGGCSFCYGRERRKTAASKEEIWLHYSACSSVQLSTTEIFRERQKTFVVHPLTGVRITDNSRLCRVQTLPAMQKQECRDKNLLCVSAIVCLYI